MALRDPQKIKPYKSEYAQTCTVCGEGYPEGELIGFGGDVNGRKVYGHYPDCVPNRMSGEPKSTVVQDALERSPREALLALATLYAKRIDGGGETALDKYGSKLTTVLQGLPADG